MVFIPSWEVTLNDLHIWYFSMPIFSGLHRFCPFLLSTDFAFFKSYIQYYFVIKTGLFGSLSKDREPKVECCFGERGISSKSLMNNGRQGVEKNESYFRENVILQKILRRYDCKYKNQNLTQKFCDKHLSALIVSVYYNL